MSIEEKHTTQNPKAKQKTPPCLKTTEKQALPGYLYDPIL